MKIPATHGDKLKALLNNNKLPASDKAKVSEAISKYTIWRDNLLYMEGDFDAIISGAVELLNIYKNYIEIDLYFAEYVVLCFLGITAQERRKYAATCVCDAAEGRLRR